MNPPITRRRVLQGAAGLGALAATTAFPRFARADIPQAIIDAGKAAGKLNVIALPPDWANYGKIISTFSQRFGIAVTSQSPNASSAQELQAVRATRGQARAPDILDLGASFALIGQREGLLQPYKVSTWDTIPADMKDPDGHWTADYFGVVSFGVNKNVVEDAPQTWADLLKPEYKNMIALNGNPLGAGAAFGGVYAAAIGNGGSLDNITPGIEFFAKLAKAGNFIPVGATPATIESGQTPITINWDYLNLGYRDQFASRTPIEVVIPKDGVFGNYYAMAINRYAPNLDAAKLWMEFVYSDEGQLLFLEGYAHPARFADLSKNGKIPAELQAKLPPSEFYIDVKFPTDAQQQAAEKALQENWQSMVGR